ncbi:MAG TPA: serine hydrolase domain-containing protein [Planktothrix sp.]|jgi:CubicO group peptidase (beta-lactamase class C family)
MPSTPVEQLQFTLESAELQEHGIDPLRLKRLYERIEQDVKAELYPGAALALARGGTLLATRAFGQARLASDDRAAKPADLDTLWLLYSQTKPITSCAIWILAERGILNLQETVSHYIPEFSKHNKNKVTVFHLLTHQAGFPNACVPESMRYDHELLRQAVCDFPLEWEPGARVVYHGLAAHWVLAVLIESVVGMDFRHFVRQEILQPLGLKNLFYGTQGAQADRLAVNYERLEDGTHSFLPDCNSEDFFSSGNPGAGAVATAADVAMFYQMLLGLGELNGVRILSPRMVQYATRNHTGDRVDEYAGVPMHRGLGVVTRGHTAMFYGLSSTAHANAYGHGGIGSSYSWADPETKVSFTYLTNSRLPEPLHSRRHEEIMTMSNALVIEL